MAKYIDFDKLMEAIEKDIEPYKSWDCTKFDVVMDTILEAPTADVVEVCRCKECANGYNKTNIKVVCKIWGRVMLPEDYCSYGAKMDGGKAEGLVMIVFTESYV